MKINIKSVVLGVIIGILITSSVAVGATLVTKDVYINPFKILLNGNDYEPIMPILNYEGRTYVPLRELATLTGSEVDFTNDNIMINNKASQNKNKVTLIGVTKLEKELKSGNNTYTWTYETPQINGLKDDVARKIQNKLIDIYYANYDRDNAHSYDEIMEILEYYDGLYYNQSYELAYYNDNIICFKYNMDGTLGGVGWMGEEAYVFDRNTGDLLSFNDIVNNKQNFINICKEEINKQLVNDERYEYLFEDYKDALDLILQDAKNIYLTKDEIVIIAEKYEIGPGACGIFEFGIPYERLMTELNYYKIK